MLDAATRARREALVAGHSGGSLLEVLALLLHGPVLAALSRRLRPQGVQWEWCLTIDAAVLVMPLVLCVTILSDWLVESLAAWTGILLLTVSVIGGTSRSNRSGPEPPRPTPLPPSAPLCSYTLAARSFKGLSVLLVALCILAVDFGAFPRRFCKTEAQGLALMDLGAATTIAAGGLLSHAATSSGARLPTPSARSIVAWGGQDAAVVLLGLARWLAVRVLNYQQPESEYGRNWNFFFTIACVAACARALPREGVGAATRGLLGATILAALQAALLYTPLAAFILSAERSPVAPDVGPLTWPLVSLWHSDREGLVSVPVMLAVLLLSQALGALYCRRCASDGGVGFRAWLIAPPLLLAGLYAACCQLDPPSRRLGNAAHIAAVFAAVCAVLSAFLALPHAADSSALLGLLSDHALTVFAAANALTGLVNVTVDTASVSDSQAVGTLFVYAGLLVATARFCQPRAVVKY